MDHMSEAWSQYHVTALMAKFKEKAGSSVSLLDCLGAEIFKNRSILHESNAVQAPQDLPIDQWISEFKSIFSEQHESSYSRLHVFYTKKIDEQSGILEWLNQYDRESTPT